MTRAHEHPAQEADRIPASRVLLLMATCVALILAAIAWAGWEARALLAPARSLPEAVALSVPERVGRVYQDAIPSAESERRRDAARERLESYGWIDRRRGLVRIPIARAIELRADEEGP